MAATPKAMERYFSAASQCQGAEALHALAALPETLGVASADVYLTALHEAAAATLAAAVSWLQLLALLGRPCSRLLHVVTLAAAPAARDVALHVGREAWALAAAQPYLIPAAAAVLLALLLIWRFFVWLGRRRYGARASAALRRARGALRRRYESFLQGVRRRSQRLGWLLSACLPHASYAAACVVSVRLAELLGVRAYLPPLLAATMPLLASYAPAARTLLTLNVPADTLHWLRFWVVWASGSAVVELWRAAMGWVPFASRLLALAHDRAPVPVEELAFCGLLWLQLPHAGVAALHGLLAPRLLRRSAQATALLPTLPAPARAGLSLVVGAVVPSELRRKLGDVAAEGGMLLGGAFFLMTPSSICGLGLTYFSLLHPALASAKALAALQGATPREPDAAVSTQLQYWMLHVSLQGCWLEMASTLFEDSAPPASLDCLKARTAPTHPGAPPEPLGSKLTMASGARLRPPQS